MDEYLAQLKPVSEWSFRLWRVVWSNPTAGTSLTLWCVSTDNHLDEECQRRWPNSYYTEYTAHDEGEAPRPRQVGTIHGRRIDEDAWTAGERIKK